MKEKTITFIDFLKGNGIDFDNRMEHNVEAFYPEYWVKNMVDFENAPEGRDFWEDLDDEWQYYVSKQLDISFRNENQ